LYAVLRFLIEFVRADDRGALFGLSTSQLIGVAIVAGCAVVWPAFRRGKLRLDAPVPVPALAEPKPAK
jgi:phosphatidylglycerol:prolipoprotein diacylglycerol transferase